MPGSLISSPYSLNILVRKLFGILGRQKTFVYTSRTTFERLSLSCYGVVGPAVAQTVPKFATYFDEDDKNLNAYVSNRKISKQLNITVRAAQTLIYVSKLGLQVIGLIS
jgi:hypothetical protein